MEAIVATPLTNGRVHDSQGSWIDLETAAKEYGFTSCLLSQYRKQGCWALGGRKVLARKVLTWARGGAGDGGDCGMVLPESDLQRVVAARQEEVTPPRGWLTAGQAYSSFGFTKDALSHWRSEGCVHLGGRKLSAKSAG